MEKEVYYGSIYKDIDKHLDKMNDCDREKVLENLSIDIARNSDDLGQYLDSLK